jgi:tetratricopeptide (TPR) repeat protein
MEIEMQYYINVSKPGYKTITINVNGTDMKSVWHWKLEPIGQGPTSGNLDEAYALNDECRLYYDKKDYDTAIDRCTRALAIAEKYLEHDSMGIEKFYRMLGLVYVARGVYSMDSDRLNADSETAKYYLKKALSIRENQLGPNDPQTVDLRNFMVEIFGTDFFKR